MRDTLAMNVFRALAVIAAWPEIERRVREELEGADLTSPEDVDGLELPRGVPRRRR